MYIVTFSIFCLMNYIDENTILEFANLTLQYLAEQDEYDSTQLWQHLENAKKLHDRLNALVPFVQGILDHEKNL